ncbi:hypothetical protein RIF29_33179 [Crotalaria pallida]|uniref:EF-hand domain-containing protein n=1 Tax=Crotalaria pallida TaxID=3830 RepID=A0AAN9EDE3_CROPI
MGISMAFMAAMKGYKMVLTMPSYTSLERRVIAENILEEEISGLKEMFKMIHAGNSGQITFEELKIGLKAFVANLSESKIYDLMQAVETEKTVMMKEEEVKLDELE